MSDFLERRLKLIEQLETAFEDIAIRELRRVLARGSRSLGELVASQASDATSVDDLATVPTDWRDAVATTLVPRLQDAYAAGAESSTLSIMGIENVPAIAQAVGEEWLAGASNRLSRIGDEAWAGARAELVEGFQLGEDIDALKRRVRKTLDVTSARARVIARTTVIGASNAGSMVSAAALGVTTKTWMATADARTRPAHLAASGQTLNMTEPFQVGGSLLQYPGDPAGSAAQTANCRCTLLYDSEPPCVCTPSWAGGATAALTAAAGRSNCECSETPSPSGAADTGRVEVTNARDFDPIEHRNAGGSFNAGKARQWGDDEWEDWRRGLSGPERQSIRAYTSSNSYEGINAKLRGRRLTAAEQKRSDVLDRHIRNMDSAFDRPGAVVPEDVQAYRTMTGPVSRRLNELFDEGRLIAGDKGARFRDPGYASTTLDRGTFNTAGQWKSVPAEERVVMDVRLRTGQRGIYVGGDRRGSSSPLSNHPREAEIILPRNSSFDIVSAERRGRQGVLHITVEVV